ncbi:hypothetical protein [Sediminibacterium sp.]|uniref:hypothetical protein n=1 Tax=Sediminibacterium sp. TaxID=1917865 RepID=UPI00273262E2|nr:hypothetical protein [Sediminibacterium sp.]MDP3394221.1 hypothetical protein [Sediminibacterium sp.]MDP3566190.1 hypothetical protein [Sediminibacterium sp.]
MLLLSAGFVGLASSVLIYLIKRYKGVNTTWISVYLFVFFLIVISQYYQFYGTSETLLNYTIFLSNILFFLLGPILYFYIRILLNQQEVDVKKDWVHFIPLIICFVAVSPWIILDSDDKNIFVKALMNNRLLLIANPENVLLIAPQILMILIPTHILTYLIVCLYKIIKEDAVNPGIVHKNATTNTLIYLFLLFQCYVAIMYSLSLFSIFYQLNLSPDLVTNISPENFNGTKHGVAALIILVLITTALVFITDTKSTKKKQYIKQLNT